MMRGENRDLTETGLIKGDVSCSTPSSSSEETFDLEADVQYQYLKETGYGLQQPVMMLYNTRGRNHFSNFSISKYEEIYFDPTCSLEVII